MKKFAAIALLWASAAFGQVFTTLYLPTQGAGLTLNIAAGRAFCGGSVVTYAGGTLTMAASVTNRVYLNTASSCVPAVKSSAFTSSDLPVATVVTSGSAITSVTDARTMMNQTLVASQVVGSINGSPGAYTFNGAGVNCVGTTCTFTGGTFSNPMTTLGDFIVGGSGGTPQRLAVGTDGQVATADHTATNGVKWATPASFPQLLDSNSLVIWGGPDSTVGDDGGLYQHGTQIPMVGWSRSGSVCTFQSSSPYTWSLNQWFTPAVMGGWPSNPSPYAPWTSGYDLFQVASIIDSTHWTASCPLISASSGSGGSAENANFFLPFFTASLPFFKNATHKVVLPIGSTVVSMAANYSTTIHPLITSWLSGHPGATVLVELTGGRNDIQFCTSNATLKADLLAVAASIHADGGVVSMSTLTPNPWNTTNLGCHLSFFNATDLNNWVKAQLPSDTTTSPNCSTACGKYFDRVIDVDGPINNLNSTYWYNGNGLTSAAIGAYAHMLNDYTATQTSVFSGYPDNIGSGPLGGTISPGFGITRYATSTGKFAETWWTNDGNGLLFGIDGSNGPYFPLLTNTSCIGTTSQGYPAGTNCIVLSETDGNIIFGSGGVWTKGTALPNGITATTQTPGDNTTKVATDAFVLANAVGLTDPGSNGILKRTALNTTSISNASDLAGPTYVAGGGTGDAQTLTLSPAIAAYTTGLKIRWKPNAGNTLTTPTIAVNGLATITAVKCGSTPLVANDWTATAIMEATYDGTNFQVTNPQAVGCGSGATTATGTSPITVNGNSGTPQNGPFVIACATCSVGSGTAVNINSGSTLGSLAMAGDLPIVCADSSGSGTAQTCTTSPSFTPQTNNCLVYTTTTTNSGTGLTLNIDSFGAKSVAVAGSSGWTTTLTTSAIPANQPMRICYDGTNWNASGTGITPSVSSTPAWTISNVTASRVINTAYQNTTGFPMIVVISVATVASNGTEIKGVTDSSSTPTTQVTGSGATFSTFSVVTMLYFVVKPGDYYKLPTSAGLSSIIGWTEYTVTAGTMTISAELSGSRVTGTAYQNTSGFPMWIQVELSGAGGTVANLLSDSSSTPTVQVWKQGIIGSAGNADFLVPVMPGDWYKVTNVSGTATIQHIREITWSGVTEYRSPSLSARTMSNITLNYLAPVGKSLWTVASYQSNSGGTMNGYYDPISGQGEGQATSLNTGISPTYNIAGFSGSTSEFRSLAFGVSSGGLYDVRFDNNGTPTFQNWFDWTFY